jgi:hypothetical protein
MRQLSWSPPPWWTDPFGAPENQPLSEQARESSRIRTGVPIVSGRQLADRLQWGHAPQGTEAALQRPIDEHIAALEEPPAVSRSDIEYYRDAYGHEALYWHHRNPTAALRFELLTKVLEYL